jgi:hypothetical protein
VCESLLWHHETLARPTDNDDVVGVESRRVDILRGYLAA